MSSKAGLRVGILGAGAMGEQHLDAWHQLFLVTPEEVLRVMRVVSAVRESAEYRRPIALEPGSASSLS